MKKAACQRPFSNLISTQPSYVVLRGTVQLGVYHMAELRLRIRIKKGTRGVPLDKLQNIAGEAKRFLRALAKDVKVESNEADWIGVDFKNQSLSFTAILPKPIPLIHNNEFNDAVVALAKQQPCDYVSSETARYFGNVSRQLASGDRLGVFSGANGHSKVSWIDVAPEVRQSPLAIECIASIQGIIHSWYKEGAPPVVYVRELSTEQLIKCTYEDKLYDRVAAANLKRQQVVNLQGIALANKATRKFDVIHISELRLAPTFTPRDLERFFGSAKNLTGKKTTAEYIEEIREHRDEA